MSVAVLSTKVVTGGMVYDRPSTDVGKGHDVPEGRGMGCSWDGGGGGKEVNDPTLTNYKTIKFKFFVAVSTFKFGQV